MMQLVLISNPDQLTELRHRFPLLDRCSMSSVSGGPTRMAVVGDAENTAVAVLGQSFPYPTSPVQVHTMAFENTDGLHRLLYFLARLRQDCRAYLSSINVPSRCMQLAIQNCRAGIQPSEVDRILDQHRFRLPPQQRQATASGGGGVTERSGSGQQPPAAATSASSR